MLNNYGDLPKPFFALAPMDDVTDTAFRQVIAATAKPDLFFTEFINVDGLQSPGRAKLLHKLRFTETEQPIIAQIWGKNPDNYCKTAKELVKMGFAGIDINMGCPDRSVVKNGCGSALINNRPLAVEIIEATKRGIGGKIPVSVKLRIGFTDVDLSWPEFILNQGIDMLTVHGRTTRQMSKGDASWAHIATVASMARQIAPKTLVVGNGDVGTRLQGEQLAKKHGLDGIMIGRGVFSDPFIFATILDLSKPVVTYGLDSIEIKTVLSEREVAVATSKEEKLFLAVRNRPEELGGLRKSSNSPWAEYPPAKRLDLYKKQIAIFADAFKEGEKSIQSLKKFAKIYINGFDGAHDLRAKFMKSTTTDEMLAVLDQYH